MADYIVGDLHGCFDGLKKLLKKINFSIDRDRVFFLGDIVNRGDKSLQTLRFIKSLKDNAQMVLGNHDLHLLACALGMVKTSVKNTFNDIINASDRNKLIDFLLIQPLVIKHQGVLIVHAGIPPNWDEDLALTQSQTIQKHLQSLKVASFLKNMYGNKPSKWIAGLSDTDINRYTINALTRMRFCSKDGELEFNHKMSYAKAPDGYLAWFLHKERILNNTDIFFGHWSTLSATQHKHIYPLDYGYVWGGSLAAIRLSDKALFTVKH